MRRKNSKGNHTIDAVDPINLEEELKDFDHVRWAIACRHMQIRLLHGDIEAAKNVLEVFQRGCCKIVAGINSPIQTVFDQRLADLLEDKFEIKTVYDADMVTDEQYLDADGLGDTFLSVIRKTIAAIKEGIVYEDWATTEIDELIDDTSDLELILKAINAESKDTRSRREAHQWINRKPSKKVSA